MASGGADSVSCDGEGLRGESEGADEAGDGVGTVGVCAREARVGEGTGRGGESGADEGEGDAACRFHVHGDYLPILQPKVPVLIRKSSKLILADWWEVCK